jgi:hypothetical protein
LSLEEAEVMEQQAVQQLVVLVVVEALQEQQHTLQGS